MKKPRKAANKLDVKKGERKSAKRGAPQAQHWGNSFYRSDEPRSY